MTPAPSAHISLITHVRPDKGWLACFPIMAWMRTLPPQPACSQLLSQLLPSCTSAAARLPSDYYYAASEETSIRSSESFSNLLLDSNLVLFIFPPAQEHAGFLDYRKDSPVWRLGGFLEHPQRQCCCVLPSFCPTPTSLSCRPLGSFQSPLFPPPTLSWQPPSLINDYSQPISCITFPTLNTAKLRPCIMSMSKLQDCTQESGLCAALPAV